MSRLPGRAIRRRLLGLGAISGADNTRSGRQPASMSATVGLSAALPG